MRFMRLLGLIALGLIYIVMTAHMRYHYIMRC